MKKFDLEKARAGAKVCTSGGLSVRIICYDAMDTRYPIIALVRDFGNEYVYHFTLEGESPSCSLYMVSEKHYAWTNIYKRKDGTYITGCHHPDKESALGQKGVYDDIETIEYIDTIKIEWEE